MALLENVARTDESLAGGIDGSAGKEGGRFGAAAQALRSRTVAGAELNLFFAGQRDSGLRFDALCREAQALISHRPGYAFHPGRHASPLPQRWTKDHVRTGRRGPAARQSLHRPGIAMAVGHITSLDICTAGWGRS